MPSSFDALTEAQEAELQQTEPVPSISYYDSCARLFASYRASDLRIRHGFKFKNGEAEPTTHDFCADIILKAKRVLTPRELVFFDVFTRDAETVRLLPRTAQDKLNIAFQCIFHAYLPLIQKAQRAYDAEQRQLKRKTQVAAHRAMQEATAILGSTETDSPFAANLNS